MMPVLVSVLLGGAVSGLALVLAAALWHGLPTWRAAHARHWQHELRQFFLFIDPALVWGASVVGAVGVAACALLLTGSLLLAGLLALACLPVPAGVLRHLRRRRAERFDGQLPDALMALAAALRAGAAPPSALRHLATDAEPPLSQEFALVLREQRLGVSLDQALQNLAQRLPTEATILSVAALRIATDTGGNLAEALERVAATVRARLHMHGRIDALTAQGRLQAWIVGALPMFLLFVLSWLEPAVMLRIWQEPLGWGVLLLVALLEVVGIWWVRRIVSIDV